MLETKLFSWFKNSYLKTNPEIVSIDEIPDAAISSKKSLGVTLNWIHTTEFCHKVCKKFNALRPLSNSMWIKKRRTLVKAFVESQSIFRPSIWMLHFGILNSKPNIIYGGLYILAINYILMNSLIKMVSLEFKKKCSHFSHCNL